MDYIAGLNANDVNRGNMQTNIANAISGMEHQRNTLAADTANKTRINEINEFKAYWESQAKIAEANKDVALMRKAEGELSKIPAEIAKLKSGTAQDYAAAGASSREMKVGLNPKSGKYEYVNVANGKFTGVEASPKDIKAEGSGGKRPWDSNISVAGAVGNLSREIDSKGNVTTHSKIDTVKFNAMKKQVEAEGGDLRKFALDPVDTPGFGGKDALEIPVVVAPGAKVIMDDIVDALMSIHGYSREDAIAQYNQTVINAQKKRSGK